MAADPNLHVPEGAASFWLPPGAPQANTVLGLEGGTWGR